MPWPTRTRVGVVPGAVAGVAADVVVGVAAGAASGCGGIEVMFLSLRSGCYPPASALFPGRNAALSGGRAAV
ncbi:hypothetical protein Stube_46580 [Streptomyces tubercidicus]|uniref:Uncharacterized protein n=1 Tax=Streptomyces tubercidicus TaxID=47759 RepID=A0A640UZH2_9ACTN|nr:hypothetical protein Stube_46580 [Streptomyces tubercidicus]